MRRFVDYVQLIVGGAVRAHVTTVSEQADAGKRLDWSAALSLVFKARRVVGVVWHCGCIHRSAGSLPS
jgi:hypothetical protein